MHEISLAGEILRLVEQAQVKESFRQVKYLRLEAGALSGVDVLALRFAIDSIAPGTCLESALIEIEEPPAMAWCSNCRQQVPLRSRLDCCPQCDSAPLEATGGTGLRVLDLRAI